MPILPWLLQVESVDAGVGGERAAAMYSIIQTAKLNGLNPEAYLRDTLTRIAESHPINRIEELMPWPLGIKTAETV